MPMSVNFPRPSLRKRELACPSLATYASRSPIRVEIAPSDLHTITGRGVNPRSRAHVTKTAVAVVAE